MSEMTKIVYNGCYGGFSLSDEAIRRYCEIRGIALYEHKDRFGYAHYTTVPQEEYERLCAEDTERANEVYVNDRDIDRTDPTLVQVVEELGDAANGMCAKLLITMLPKGTIYRISEYDGCESVNTMNDYTDWKVA